MKVTLDKLNNLYNIKTNIISDINELNSDFLNINEFIVFHLKIRSITKHFSQLLVMSNNKIRIY